MWSQKNSLDRRNRYKIQDTRYLTAEQLDKLLFEELKMDSGQWKVNVSTAWIYLKYIAEGDTTTVNCQLSTAKLKIRIYRVVGCREPIMSVDL